MSLITLKYECGFDAAHRLLHYKGPCNNLHGHHWKVELELKGEVNEKSGMLIDFQEIKKILKSTIMDKFDHGAIFNFEDKALWQNLQPMGMKVYTLLGEPTCENLANCIFQMLCPIIKTTSEKMDNKMFLASVRVWESDHASAIADGVVVEPDKTPMTDAEEAEVMASLGEDGPAVELTAEEFADLTNPENIEEKEDSCHLDEDGPDLNEEGAK